MIKENYVTIGRHRVNLNTIAGISIEEKTHFGPDVFNIIIHYPASTTVAFTGTYDECEARMIRIGFAPLELSK